MLTFELLAVDNGGNATCNNAQSLLFSIRGLSVIWDSPTIDEENLKIRDGSTSIVVTRVEPPEIEADDTIFDCAYLISLTGEFENIEALREPLTAYLKERQQFSLLYVVCDQVSQQIACELYPLLYRIENRLRGYLIKFMTIQLGPGWWKQTAPRSVDDKVKLRKKNEKVFGRHIDNFTYLTDFGELGAMVYQQSSGFLTREDIVERLNKIPETPEAIRKLKAELQTNYQKYFSDSFANKQFKEKWKQFEYLRNKIAHNNLFTADDLELGKQLFDELKTIIKNADNQTATLQITPQEREALQETVSEVGGKRRQITQDELIEQLSKQQNHYDAPDGFVGISRFVRGHLLNEGFEPNSCYRMIELLETQGKIEVYQVPNPHSEYNTSALRIP